MGNISRSDKKNHLLPSPSRKRKTDRSVRTKIAQLVIARLEGRKINEKFGYYRSLAEEGIGGFIIFGGRRSEVRRAVRELQESASIPLFIASDLEQGLGQQIEGGTLFPPAMAIAQAIDRRNKGDVSLLRKAVSIMASEAHDTGINTIFSPVLDVNTNPQNPIICTRAFSDDPGEVAWFGREFIRGFQRHGIIACAKHFPGHGDTTKDSHRELPVVKADIERLRAVELYPFARAVQAGVGMIMMGHLKVPAIDPRFPASLSEKITTGLLRGEMNFKGLIITDAMNMRAVTMGEGRASVTALKAGADIILHPSAPEEIIDYICSKWEKIEGRVEESHNRIIRAKRRFNRRVHQGRGIGGSSGRDVVYTLTEGSVRTSGEIPAIESPVVLVIDDDNSRAGRPFVNAFKKRYRKTKVIYADNKTISSKDPLLPLFIKRGEGGSVIIAVFSKVSAWKGRSGLSSELKTLIRRAVEVAGCSAVIGFCCPYTLSDTGADATVHAYSDSEQAQEIAASLFGPR